MKLIIHERRKELVYARAENSQYEKGVEPTVPGCGIDEGGNIKVEKIFPSKSMKQSTFHEFPQLL